MADKRGLDGTDDWILQGNVNRKIVREIRNLVYDFTDLSMTVKKRCDLTRILGEMSRSTKIGKD